MGIIQNPIATKRSNQIKNRVEVVIINTIMGRIGQQRKAITHIIQVITTIQIAVTTITDKKGIIVIQDMKTTTTIIMDIQAKGRIIKTKETTTIATTIIIIIISNTSSKTGNRQDIMAEVDRRSSQKNQQKLVNNMWPFQVSFRRKN